MGIIRSHFSPEFVISCSPFFVIEKRMSAHEFFFPASFRIPLRFGVGGYSLFVVWASLRPAGTGGAIPHMDKVLHLLVYAILALGMAVAWPKLSKFKIFWTCVVFGGVMELAQGFIGTGRTASFFDGLANSLGVALGVYIASIMSVKFAR